MTDSDFGLYFILQGTEAQGQRQIEADTRNNLSMKQRQFFQSQRASAQAGARTPGTPVRQGLLCDHAHLPGLYLSDHSLVPKRL